MITGSGRERSAFGLERDPVPRDLSSIAANIAGPVGDSVSLACPFLTQKEVLYPMFFKFSAGLPVRVLTKIRIKCGCKFLQGCYGQERFGNIG